LIDDADGRPNRVDPESDQPGAGSGGSGTKHFEVVAHDVNGLRNGWSWAGAELDLPTGLDGE
jgi:hypothetical protein